VSLFRSRLSTRSSSAGYVPRGFPTILEGRFDTINVLTIEDAQRTVAFDAALDLIASLVSELPVGYWSGPPSDTARTMVRPPKWMGNPSGYVDDGGSVHGIEDWIYQIVVSLVGRGNVFGRVLDTRGTVITQLDILHPDRVKCRDVDGPWHVDGSEDRSIRHWRSNPLPGTRLGTSLVTKHMINLKIPQTAAAFGAQWFTDGGHPSALLTNEYLDANSLDSKAAKQIKDKFLATARGRREPAIFGRGWKYQSLSVTPEESQFLATLGYSQAEVARMFGPGVPAMLGYEAATGLSYSNPQSRTSDLLTFTVGKWIRRVERIMRAMCPAGIYPELHTDSVINADPATLYKNLAVAVAARLMTPNEARRIMRLPATEWGDEPNPIAGANMSMDGVTGEPDNKPDEPPVKPDKKPTKKTGGK
jgi:HK97 family phage portal protein